jgi:hypothetical protein
LIPQPLAVLLAASFGTNIIFTITAWKICFAKNEKAYYFFLKAIQGDHQLNAAL